MPDKFSAFRVDLTSPIVEGFDLVANDSYNSAYSQPTRALWVGSAGNVRVRLVSSTVVSNQAFAKSNSNNFVTFGGVQAGTMLPIRIDMVAVTGTTANGFVGLF